MAFKFLGFSIAYVANIIHIFFGDKLQSEYVKHYVLQTFWKIDQEKDDLTDFRFAMTGFIWLYYSWRCDQICWIWLLQ